MLMRRKNAERIRSCEEMGSRSNMGVTQDSCSEIEKRSFDQCSEFLCSSSQESQAPISREDESFRGSITDVEFATKALTKSQSEYIRTEPGNETKKKAKKSQWSQLSLKSFFQKNSTQTNVQDDHNNLNDSSDFSEPNDQSNEPPLPDDRYVSPQQYQCTESASTQNQAELSACSQEKNNTALQEWQRIQGIMQNSIPICKGHRESCIARVVKKQGPNFGRRFYVCARAEVFSSFIILY